MIDRRSGFNCDLTSQINCLREFVARNQIITVILERAPSLKVPNWYLGGGCIAQTVWDILHDFEPTFGIKDYDLVYHDVSDVSFETEAKCIENAKELFSDLPVTVEVKNEARVHLWYRERFGSEIAPYESVEAAISTWPTTAASIGIRREHEGTLTVYAPFGLNDLFGMIVRPNKAQVTKEIYETKTDRWIKLWPKLHRIRWD